MAGRQARIETILREVRRWDSVDVADAADGVDGILRGREAAGEIRARAGARQEPAALGHVEVKTIKGRQYRYLRWWDGGHLRSRYLGKAGV